MKTLLVQFFAVFASISMYFLLPVDPALASVCTLEDEEYANFWDNYYDPEDAYNFGLKIQNFAKEKNLAGIFSLVDGELGNGPRKKYLADKSFEEIFDESWLDKVLSNEPDCTPVGWRGFMLGSGSIWYDKLEQGWRVFSINGGVQEETKTLSIGWRLDGGVIHPFCFSRPWMSGDNFEEFADVFGISDAQNLFSAPGKLFGTKISDYEPLRPSWCSDSEECKTISLVNEVAACSPKIFKFEIRSESIWLKDSTDGYDVEYSYGTLVEFDPQKCSDLAPNIGTKCLESFLVSIGDYSGGSMGWDMSYGIYGLFDVPKFGTSIVPLVFFENKNSALNFLDQ